MNTSEDGKIRFTIENGELVGTPEVLDESASPEVKGVSATQFFARLDAERTAAV